MRNLSVISVEYLAVLDENIPIVDIQAGPLRVAELSSGEGIVAQKCERLAELTLFPSVGTEARITSHVMHLAFYGGCS